MKMKNCRSAFLLLFTAICGYSQQLHTSAEILKILDNSKLSYEIIMLDKAIDCKDYSDKLNFYDCYRVSLDTAIFTYRYIVNDNAAALIDKAVKYVQSNNPDSALKKYRQALSTDSTLYFLMTYIGLIFEKKRDYPNAISWYKKAISKNYIDYMAHWLLADACLRINDVKSAMDEIVIAQILDRNNPAIRKSMDAIFSKAKRKNKNWCFHPQVEITKISEKKISIATDKTWTGYAMAKALWSYEPGYRESMGVSKGYYSSVEDRECCISLLMGLKNAKPDLKNDPQLMNLQEAAKNNHLDEYILYELVLPQTPVVAFQLPENIIARIKDYVFTTRNSR